VVVDLVAVGMALVVVQADTLLAQQQLFQVHLQ
jgi:hypothetical protein